MSRAGIKALSLGFTVVVALIVISTVAASHALRVRMART
jgi:hypothetical protein